MKILIPSLSLGFLTLFTGCASDPRPARVTVPPSLQEATAADAEPVEILDVPELAEGLRLFHGDGEVTMEDLARGRIPEGALIRVSAPADTRHHVISDTLIQLHSMGFLVGVSREAERSAP